MKSLDEYKFTKQSVISICYENFRLLWPSPNDLLKAIKHACLTKNELKIDFIHKGKIEVFETAKGDKSIISWRRLYDPFNKTHYRECGCFINGDDCN